MVEPDNDAPGRYVDELASAAVKYFGKKPIPPDLPGVSEIKRLKSDAKGLADFLRISPLDNYTGADEKPEEPRKVRWGKDGTNPCSHTTVTCIRVAFEFRASAAGSRPHEHGVSA